MDHLPVTFNALPGQAAVRPSDKTAELPTALAAALHAMRLLGPGETPQARLLPATESEGRRATLHEVRLQSGTVWIKQALPVIDAGLPPAERSRFEVQWLRFAREVIGDSIPEVFAESEGAFAFERLGPERNVRWLELLGDGDISPSTAAEIGRLCGRLHAASAGNHSISQRFERPRGSATPLEHALEAAALAQPALAEPLRQLAALTVRPPLVLQHGDLTPRTVRVGARGPLFSDASRAHFGDPAFDVASCVAPLLMLGLSRLQWRDRYLTCLDGFWAAYSQRITWEMPEHTDERAARLVPALMLAAVHGDEPVSFLYGARERDIVTGFARRLLRSPVLRLAALRESWRRSFLD
jgi:hypothetical protein